LNSSGPQAGTNLTEFMEMQMKNIILLLFVIPFINACVSATQHANNVQNQAGQKLTVGTVQKEIKIGMSSADVIQVLGAPNMVSTDDKRREVWVYDKVATDTVQSTSSGWVFAILAGGNSSSGASSTSQRTLTIVIKFDEQSHVRDFAYHSSTF
jgi:outer membrane protein assembly factor BamE (lipoprotein component of BamABCDE complex)